MSDSAIGRTMEAGEERNSLRTLRERFSWSSAQLGGHEWNYIDTAASGPVVVLLPGSQGTCEVFFKPLLRLEQRLRMIAVDYAADPDAAALADGVAALLDRLSLSSASLVGSSLGSYIGQVVAARHPDRVDRLLLGNAFLDVSDVRNKPAYDPMAISATAPEAFKEQRLEWLQGTPDGELKTVLLDLVGGQSPEAVKARALAAASAPTAPVVRFNAGHLLILQCKDDATITPATKAAMRQRYPSARHVVFPHGGHYPHVLAADDYCALLARFVTAGLAAPSNGVDEAV